MQQIMEFVGNHTLLVIAFVVVFGMLVSNEINHLARNFTSLSPAGAIRLMNHETTLLIDTRSASENRNGRIISSKNIPLSELKTRVDELEKHKQDHVIVYCQSGNRSATACKILKNQGFENIYNIEGGILAWGQANLPITKS